MTLAEEVIDALRGKVIPEDVRDEELPLFPKCGPGIYTITEGPGRHVVEGLGRYEVPENQVYATISTIGLMSGGLSTYQFSKDQSGKLGLIGRICHIRC